MVTPSTNIGLSDVNTELRNTAGTNIGLGDSDVRALARVPSGNIGLDDLKNKSIVNLANNSAFDFSSPTASASATFNSNGTITMNTSTLGNFSGDGWSMITSSGLGSDYQIRAEQISAFGTAIRTGTLNTWLSLSTSRTWSIETSTLGAKNWILSISIRESAGNTVVGNASLQLDVEVL